jgi:hypothetical protein
MNVFKFGKNCIALSVIIFIFISAVSPKQTIIAPSSAIFHLQELQRKFPRDQNIRSVYEREQSAVVAASAKALSDAAQQQLLDALGELDNRITYWQYQKDHPWNYFVSKNPLKWITGPKQEDEVEENIELLKNYQGELYALLGKISGLNQAFISRHKTVFLADYEKRYEWVDEVINTLAGLASVTKLSGEPFIIRIKRLQQQLAKVDQFKEKLLATVSQTIIPSYFERNWFKGSLALWTVGYGYKKISADQVAGSVGYLKSTANLIIEPVKGTVEDLLTPQRMANEGVYETQLKLAVNFANEMGAKYHLESEAATAVAALQKNVYSSYREFIENIGKRESLNVSLYSPNKSISNAGAWVDRLADYAQGKLLGGELNIALLQKQSAALWKLLLSIPAIALIGTARAGYYRLTNKSYGHLRTELVEINSLFADTSAELNDEQHGKMIYLIYMLKRQSKKELPTKHNISAQFIEDLEKLESATLNVAAKRAVVEDMFKKYEFLGLIQKK